MSLCSRAGIEWVAQRTKSTDFQASAQLHHLEVALRLKIQKPLSIHRKPEPPITLALDYSRGRFHLLEPFRIDRSQRTSSFHMTRH